MRYIYKVLPGNHYLAHAGVASVPRYSSRYSSNPLSVTVATARQEGLYRLRAVTQSVDRSVTSLQSHPDLVVSLLVVTLILPGPWNLLISQCRPQTFFMNKAVNRAYPPSLFLSACSLPNCHIYRSERPFLPGRLDMTTRYVARASGLGIKD